MKNNPFNGKNFQNIWLKYFNRSELPKTFKSIKQAKFYKNKKYPFYINVGKNITNGMYYKIDEDEEDYKNKTFLIYDVPTYYKIESDLNNRLKVKKAKQYDGYAVNLSEFKSFEEYFNSKFSSKSRYRYNRNLKRLESCFEINYKIFCGNIDKDEYEYIFDYLIKNIKNRFDELKLENDIVEKQDYYKELSFELICNKEAVLNVIYDKDIPISVSINFVSDEIMYFAITTFNTDYYRYDLGHTNIMKLLQWCFNEGLKVLDFSKGYSEYKIRWANNEYRFEHHVLYDSNSIKSIVISNLLYNYFVFKQFLRDKKFNKFLSKINYLAKEKNSNKESKHYKFEVLDNIEINHNDLNQIELHSEACKDILKSFYTHLYNNPEKIDNIKLYKSSSEEDTFYAIGDKNKIKFFV